MAIESAAQLLVATVDALAARAPAVVAAAARRLGGIVLALHFGDGTHAELRAVRSSIVARAERPGSPHVEVHFDDRSLNLLFDIERRPVDQVLAGSLDVRGERDQILAVWGTFQLLAQRASGLRWVQALWREYRDRSAHAWGSVAPRQSVSLAPPAFAPPRATRWTALDYLDRRSESVELDGDVVGGTVRAAPRLLWDGRRSQSWWDFAAATDADLFETMRRCKQRVQDELRRIVPNREPKQELYDLMFAYPAREGKGLRPTLTLASCAAFGGRVEDAVRMAAAIELFHNGFLVHDDVADESTHRRNLPTLHESHGVGMAVNTGDAMHLLAIDTVLSNLPTLGLARTLGLIHEVMHMCRETVEGQAIELGWIRRVEIPTSDNDYFRMSTKKTGWYTCISPCRLGAICAGTTDPAVLDRFNEALRLVGIAFQIQDDLLNLIGDEALYGKEPLGDLLEGKRTVMMIHLFRETDRATRDRLLEIVRLPRHHKTQAEAKDILAAMERTGSLDYAAALADRLAHEGVDRFEADLTVIPENEAKGVLRQIANYVTTRIL